ncbi:MAG: phosphoadenosine phosphosulfate reductase family protein, partial [Chloroflexi bacterium]|nr:phosphoadenosine phosphosulfate reductase family protein [Chloroflexota bacterium]
MERIELLVNNWTREEIEQWTAEELRLLPLDEKVERSQAIIKAAVAAFQPKIGFAMSFGKDSTAIAHMVKSIYGQIPIPALFTDTRLKFPETYG